MPFDSTRSGNRPAPDSLGTLRRTLVRQLRPRPALYFADLSLSAGLGWSAFAGAAALGLESPLRWALTPLAALALLRAAFFVHEIAHLSARAVPGFEILWNVVVGVPLGLPSLMVDAHRDHHRRTTYGTALDPEYELVTRWRRRQVLGSVLVSALVLPLLPLRWAVLAPLSFLVPGLRRLVVRALSALATNDRYRRDFADGRTPRFVVLELACAAFFWTAAVALAHAGWLGTVALQWALVAALAGALNQARTLVAHAYEGRSGDASALDQAADSLNLDAGGWWWEPFLPVGTRFHAAHHVLPTLPYHALPQAHARLMAVAGPEYRAASGRSPGEALLLLWRAAGARGVSR